MQPCIRCVTLCISPSRMLSQFLATYWSEHVAVNQKAQGSNLCTSIYYVFYYNEFYCLKIKIKRALHMPYSSHIQLKRAKVSCAKTGRGFSFHKALLLYIFRNISRKQASIQLWVHATKIHNVKVENNYHKELKRI